MDSKITIGDHPKLDDGVVSSARETTWRRPQIACARRAEFFSEILHFFRELGANFA